MSVEPSSPIDSHRLDNGLQVLAQEDHSLPLVAVNLWYHVGSKDERPGRTGFAHLFEHMLFQGSEHVDTNGHFAWVQQVGGVANGSTWYDRTNYYETLPREHLELGLWLESDRMGFLLPALTEEKLATQKAVVINERRQRVDNAPYGRASERLHELLYPDDHPYRWPVIGYTEDIEAASLEEVRDFFRRYYAPSNAVLTLVGDFDTAAAVDLVERYFGPLDAGEPPPPVEPDAFEVRPRREVHEDRVALVKSTWATRVPRVGEPDWYRACLLSEVLTGGRSGVLYRLLVQEREQAQAVGTYVMPTELCATFALQAVGREGQSEDELEASVRQALEDIVSGGIEPDEVARAVNAVLTSQIEELEAFDDRADAISMGQTLFDDPEFAFSETERLRAVSRDELQAAAEELLELDECINVTVIPAERAPSEAAS